MSARTVSIGAAVLVFAGLCATADAIVVRHDRPAAVYLELGAAARFEGVGQMRNAAGALRGTGTYLGDGWVLTAAHVADDSNDWSFRDVYGFEHTVAERFIHPDWTGDPNQNHDIALMRLESPLIGLHGTAIATTSVAVGDAIEFAGFGFTGDGLTGITNDGGQQLRAGTNVAELKLNDFGLEYFVSFFDAPGSGFETDLEAQGAFNDSGGPVLRQTDGVWEIVGVTSFIQESLDGSGDGVLSNYGDLTGFADVPLYLDWINATVPSPGTAALFAPAALLATRRRR